MRPQETVFLAQVPEIAFPPGFEVLKVAKGVQMVATRSLAETAPADIRLLTDDDAPEMLALS